MIPTLPRSPNFLPQALSSLESVITSFPFFYRPKGLRLGDAWHFHPPERYYKRVAREVGEVLGAHGCVSAAPGRGMGSGHSLGALHLAFASPWAADQRLAAERGERGLQRVPQLPPRGDRASLCGRRCPGAQRPLPPGRPLPCAQLPPRAQRNREPAPPQTLPLGPTAALLGPFLHRSGQFAARLPPAGSNPFWPRPVLPPTGPAPSGLP